MKYALVIAAAIVFSANAAQAQQCPIAQHCMICAARGAQALYRAGDSRQVRIVNEAKRRGGTLQAVQSLSNTRDYQSALRSVRRACGCLRPGC
jgi:hypothetical protein